jgi:RND family efflux transporter MFP subunit
MNNRVAFCWWTTTLPSISIKRLHLSCSLLARVESIMQPGVKSLFLGSFVVLPLVLAGCSSEPPASQPKPPKVTVSKPIVKPDEVDYDDYTGSLVATDPVQVRSKVRGFVKEIHFKDPPKDKPAEGEIVRKGDPLFDLDPEPFQDEIVQAKEKVKVYEAQRVAAEKERVRLTELEKKGGASRAQVEKAEADVQSLDAQINASKVEVKLRVRDLEEYSKIKAPITGRIGQSLVAQGELVRQGETLLTTINSIDPIKVKFYANEQAVQRFRQRALNKSKDGKLPPVKEAKVPFKFALDTDRDFVHEGILDFADNQTDPNTGTILVRGETPNKNAMLLPGYHVRVRVPVSDPYEALLVPDTAVNTDQDKKYLLVVDDKKIAQRRDVRLGKLTDKGLRVVETNLKPKDLVIIEGTQRARIGQPVTPEVIDLAAEMKKGEGRAGE